MSDLRTATAATHPRPPTRGPRTHPRTLDGVVPRLPAGRLRRLPPHRAGRQPRPSTSPAASSPGRPRRHPGLGAWEQARPRPLAWIVATAVGLMAGVALGAALVDYQTDLGALVLQGAVSGAVLGTRPSDRARAAARSACRGLATLPRGTFALGWAVTTSAGIDVDQQFTIFGSSGALLATLLTAVPPLALNRRARSTEVTPCRSPASASWSRVRQEASVWRPPSAWPSSAPTSPSLAGIGRASWRPHIDPRRRERNRGRLRRRPLLAEGGAAPCGGGPQAAAQGSMCWSTTSAATGTPGTSPMTGWNARSQ